MPVESTFNERLENTKTIIFNDEVTPEEAARHLYYFLKFEFAFWQAERAKHRMEKYHRVLNENLEVFKLRMQMSEL